MDNPTVPLTSSQPQPLKKFDIKTRDIVYVILMVISSILLSAFGAFGGFRGGFTVSALILIVVLLLFLLNKGCKFRLFSSLCFVLDLGVLSIFSITSNGAVRFFGFIIFSLLTLTWVTFMLREENKENGVGFVLTLLSPVLETVVNVPTVFVSLFSGKKSNKTLGKVFVGFILAFPVLVVVLPLLMSSDEAFSGMISIIFENTATTVIKILLGLVISIFLISFALSLKKDTPLIKKGIEFSGIEPTMIISFLSVLSVCYLSYLFSQLAYFFDAFKGFLPNGYDFSNYARRGFFEMSIIAGINFFIILLCRTIASRKNKALDITVNALSTFIGVFTLVIIATALRKMVLYIESYGMTKLRLTTSAFMIFLSIVFMALILKLYIKKINVIKTAFVTAGIVIIILGVGNVNQIVASYNYNAYKNGSLKEIDVYTIFELGDEGVPYLVKLADDKDENVRNYAKQKLQRVYHNYYEYDDKRIYDNIGEMSFSRQRAYTVLDEYYKNNKSPLG